MGSNNYNLKLFPIILFFIIAQLSAQSDSLKLVKDSDGILVYKEKNAVGNLNRVVARTEVDTDYLKVLCLIKDFGHQQDWVYANHGAFCIDSLSPTKWIFYGISETPWPFLDRDVVANVELEINYDEKELVLHSIAKPDLIPASPEMVRIQMLDSKWKLKKLENGTFIELDLVVDVGGNVPLWLVNLFAAKGPFNTFKNMKEELKHSENIKECGYKEFFK